jgi:hypothetical protein
MMFGRKERLRRSHEVGTKQHPCCARARNLPKKAVIEKNEMSISQNSFLSKP